MGSNSGNVHVVLVPFSPIGHCMPFLYLASRLAQLGVKVTFLCLEGLKSQLHNSLSFKPHARVILHKNIDIVTVKDGFSTRAGLGAADVIREESRPALVSVFSDCLSSLMSSAASLAPCCIISDMMLGFTHDVAAKFNIPRYVLHTQSAANLSLMLQVPTLLADGILPLTTTSQDVFVQIPGLKVRLRTSELPTDLDPNALIPKLLKLDSYGNFLYMSRRAAEAPIVLVNTFRELEADVLAALDETGQAPKVIPVGPLLSPLVFSSQEGATVDEDGSLEELDDSIVQFLDRQPCRSVMYVAFGTFGVTVHENCIEDIALGLEASGQPFLWSAGDLISRRQDQSTITPCLPPGFLERTKDRGMVVTTWAPQLGILNHPSTGAFLSHCGWNSILESISAGLPVIALPGRADQKMNCRFLVDVAKVAVELKVDEKGRPTSSSEVERVVRLVMQQDEGRTLKANVQALKRSNESSAASIHELTKFISAAASHVQQHRDNINNNNRARHPVI
jgi:hydroquinone glucosyltransferase